MGTNLPTDPPRHGITELLRLVAAVRHIAHDRTLPASEALGRIRDLFAGYDDHEGGTFGPFA